MSLDGTCSGAVVLELAENLTIWASSKAPSERDFSDVGSFDICTRFCHSVYDAYMTNHDQLHYVDLWTSVCKALAILA